MKYVIRLCVATILAVTASVTTASPPVPNYEGLWWNSPPGSESGWGINFAHQGDVIFATWFTYDASGKAWWLTMTATKMAEGIYSGALYSTSGAPFSNFVPPATATQVGTGTLTFTSATTGTFAYVVTGIAQTKAIVPQVFGPMPTCVWGAQPDLAKATNFQDLWWATGGTESGWGMNLTQEGTTIFATWFTYDANHNPLWLSATAPQTGPNAFSGTLYLTAGPAFSAVPFDPTKVTAAAVGTASFTFTDGNSGTFNYDVDLGDGVNKATQSKAITRQVFRAPGTVCEAASAAEGLWAGTTNNNQTARAIILDDGTYYILYSNSGNRSDAGVVQGSSSAANGILASSDGVDFPIANGLETNGSQVSAAVSGTYAPHSLLQLTIVEVSGTRTIAASYDAGYERPADLAAAAGTYTGVSGHISGARPATFTLNSNGSLVGQNDVCTFNGTVTPRKSVNVFDWTLTGNGCIFARAQLSGVLYYDEANRQIHGFAPYAARSDQFYLIGTKP